MARDIQSLKDRLDAYIRDQQLRWTAQRRLVSEVFFRSDGHLSIEDLLAAVREEDAKVGYATIYRTLKLLKECGVAYERHFGDGLSRYEVAHEDEHHDHLICLDCGWILEFENHDIERIQDDIARKNGFTLKRHKHELYGRCTDTQCQRRKQMQN